MDKSKSFLILAVLALLLAGFLTWNLVSPQQAAKFYEKAFGIKQPSGETIGKGTIHFKKTEE